MADHYATRTLREIVRVIARRFTSVLVIFCIVVGSVLVASLVAPKWYRSEAQILARPDRITDPLESPASLRDRMSLFIITQRHLLLSDQVLAAALMRLEGVPAADEPALSWYTKEQLEDYVRRNFEYLQKVRRRVKVTTPGGPETTFTQVFSVRLDWPEERQEAARLKTPSRQLATQRARKLLGLLLQAYLRRHAQLESEQTGARADFLADERLRKAQADLQQAEDELRKFVEEHVREDLPLLVAMRAGGTGIESGTATLTTQFQAEITRIDAELADMGAIKRAIDEELKKPDPADIAVPDSATAANPLLTTIQDKALQLKLRINALQTRFTGEYRELLDAGAELQAALKDLHAELSKQSTRLRQQMDALQAKRQTLQAKVAEDRQRVTLLASKAARYEELQRKAEHAALIYNQATTQYVEAEAARKLAQRKESFLVTLLDEPSIPDESHPQRPMLWLNMLIAVAAGVVLALVYAFLADHFDHSIKGIDDAERYLGATVLASVPKLGRDIFAAG